MPDSIIKRIRERTKYILQQNRIWRHIPKNKKKNKPFIIIAVLRRSM